MCATALPGNPLHVRVGAELRKGREEEMVGADADPLIARGQPSFEDGGYLCLSICEVPFFVWNKVTSN